jgi:hypothetical protein
MILGAVTAVLWRVTDMTTQRITGISKENMYFDLAKDSGLNPGELGFDMSFGFLNATLDPKIAYWELNYVTQGRFGRNKVKNSSDVFPCNNTD